MKIIKFIAAFLLVSVVAYGFINYNNSTVQQSVGVLKVGDKAPEIVLKDRKIQDLKLSSLKGKMVLIDFWASWCRPCRAENKHVVEIYKEFKDKNFKNGKGFTVFSVSLDRGNIAAWEKAIEHDGLVWDTHVMGDDKNVVATAYNVKYIPMSYLIDGEGTILAINLRGEELKNKIKSYLK